MKITIALMSSVVTCAVACAAPPDEPRESRAQAVVNGGGGVAEPGACDHAPCATGSPLVRSCDPCVAELCAADPYCCGSAWDATCVGEVASVCGESCEATTRPDVPSTCAHPVCSTGSALAKGCDACVAALCQQDAYCCTTAWDATCVGEVTSICEQACK